MTNVVIHDESMSGQPLQELTVEIPSEQITVRELIRSRVFQETKESNARAASQPIQPLAVQPTDEEVVLNGPRSNEPTPVDWRVQFDKALEAFGANQILIFIDDQQVTSLEQQIEIDSATKIRFLRLTMLMGG